MKYFIISLGCAKNLVDSERFAGLMQSYGMKEAEAWDKADVFVVNTCAFLNSSFAELDDTLCEILAETSGRKTKLIVTGCVMNRGLEKMKELFPEVNTWIPLKDFSAFEKYLIRYVLPQGTGNQELASPKRVRLHEGQHVYLRIADGCENNCSYCMIPSIRGKLVSQPIEVLVKEAKKLQRRGKELVLIAQDSCLYGTDLYGEKALPKLIEALHSIPGYDWIRLMYLHPDHFEPGWVDLWHKFPKLLPYFEIPIQQVSQPIIKAMNRKKSYDELKALFTHIKKEIPKAVFRTTLMIGYPGETAADRKLIDKFLAEVDILHAGVFGYSPEKEGKPYDPPKDFNWNKVEKLETELAIKLAQAKEAKMQRFVGTIQPALIESYDAKTGLFIGRVWFQAPEIDGIIYLEGTPESNNPLVQVEIVDALTDEMWGQIHPAPITEEKS